MSWSLCLIFSYILGAVPFGYLVGRYLGTDIRKFGSGNIGTTNAFRVLGAGPGLVVLFGDVAKGVIPVLLGSRVGGPTLAVLAGILAVIGHNWPIFLKFRGGRGVATGAGMLIALAPLVTLICFSVWIVVVLTTRYVSLGSIVAACSAPIVMLLLHQPWQFVLVTILLALVIVWRHRPNLKRLLAGTEYKLGDRVGKSN
ncbi:MAG: glycerol-3-phosphate 1-O-acyltransferase PlsY [Clostridia bacterium]|nr:glycerol-3-phosphate 1-O-acyltransferase PlsY [Clostridia bacterium]